MNNKLKFLIASVVNVAYTASLLFVFYIIIQVFFITSFKIPSASMDPVLKPGDFVWVNKLTPGARIFTSWDVFNKNKADVYRLPGTANIHRNDIVVFNYPFAKQWGAIQFSATDFFAKRCLGEPGDTFRIRNGYYFVNRQKTPIGCVYRQKFLSKMGKSDFQAIIYNTLNKWTIKNFGPLYLPRKGDNVKLDSTNIHAYKCAIEYETGRKIKIFKNHISMNGVSLADYEFKENYYFMAGDLIFDSKDSRYWGLLPEKFIVGKVCGIWWSADQVTQEIRWDRIFSGV